MSKIIDCFTFYNEIDLLTYRLNILNDVVDYFVLVEATNTHVGREKKLFYDENKHLFEKFNDKIIHVIVNNLPYKNPIHNDNVWTNENFQRISIAEGINQLSNLNDEDIIIITDLDEIPDPTTLNKIKIGDIKFEGIAELEMDFYYYNLNTKYKNKWGFPKIISYKDYKNFGKTFQEIRVSASTANILKGGWHLSYFGDKYFIQNKIQNFAHQEFNNPQYTDLDKIDYKVKNGLDLYNISTDFKRIEIEDNDYLPPQYDKYLTKYYT